MGGRGGCEEGRRGEKREGDISRLPGSTLKEGMERDAHHCWQKIANGFSTIKGDNAEKDHLVWDVVPVTRRSQC